MELNKKGSDDLKQSWFLGFYWSGYQMYPRVLSELDESSEEQWVEMKNRGLRNLNLEVNYDAIGPIWTPHEPSIWHFAPSSIKYQSEPLFVLHF